MVGRIFSLIVCSVFLVGCIKTVPIDKLDGKIILRVEPAKGAFYYENLDFITVRDSVEIKDYHIYKHDSKNLKVGDTIKIK